MDQEKADFMVTSGCKGGIAKININHLHILYKDHPKVQKMNQNLHYSIKDLFYFNFKFVSFVVINVKPTFQGCTL